MEINSKWRWKRYSAIWPKKEKRKKIEKAGPDRCIKLSMISWFFLNRLPETFQITSRTDKSKGNNYYHAHARNVPFGADGHRMWCLSVRPGKKVPSAGLPKETVQKPESRRGTERSAPGFPASVWAGPARTSRPSWPPAAPCFDYALLSWAAKAQAAETRSSLVRP